MRRHLSIRQKLALILTVAVVLPLVVAGITLSFVIMGFHEEVSRQRFESVFFDLEQQLRESALNAERTAGGLSERPGFIAEVSLLYRYLEPESYNPLIFEAVLRRLAQLLQEQTRAAGIHRMVLYDGHGRLLALYCSSTAVPAVFVEYIDSKPVARLASSEGTGEQLLTELPSSSTNPDFFRYRPLYGEHGEHVGNQTLTRVVENRLLIETSVPVRRAAVDGTLTTVGRLVAGAQVGLEPSRFPDLPDLMEAGIYRAAGAESSSVSVGLSPSLREALSAAAVGEYSLRNPLFVTGSEKYLAAVPLLVAEDDLVWVYATISRGLVQREARGTLLVILGVLAVSALLILPVGLFFENIYFGRPTQELLRGVGALRSGDYSARVELNGKDELALLGDSFNQMAWTIESYTGTLEQKVQERTQELEEANAAKSRFLARVTHEIRNPMNGVMGMAQILKSSGLDREQQEYVDIILGSSQHLLTIVNDILDISKIEAGKLALETQPFSPAEVVQGVVELFKPQITGKGVGLELKIAEEVPHTVMGDPGRLRQVLANLVSNAAKFTDKGKVTVELAPGEQPDRVEPAPGEQQGKVELCFSVQDTGIGIEADQLKQLFAEYTQVYGEKGRSAEGTGLGLSIVKELVDLMDGRVSVQSQPGQGSAFSFTAVFGREL